MDKIKTVVKIAGKEYTIVGSESEEYIHRVAIYVDKKMNEISQHMNLSTLMQAVLTAINLADVCLKQQDEIIQLKADIHSYKKELNKNQITNIYEAPRKSVNNHRNVSS